MSVRNYLDLVSEFEESPLIGGLTRNHNKSFKTKRTKYHTRVLVAKRIYSEKEDLFVNTAGTAITGQCRVFKGCKGETFFRLGRFSETKEYGFISDFCSLKRGTGTALLTHILYLSNFKNKDIILTISKLSLAKFYAKFGFKRVSCNKRILVNKASTRSF